MTFANLLLFIKFLGSILIVFYIHPNLLNMDRLFELVLYEKPALPKSLLSSNGKYFIKSGNKNSRVTSQYRGDIAHTGVDSENTVPLSLVPDWNLDLLNVRIHGASKASPAIDNTGVYVGADSSWFYALSHNGKVKWKHFIGDSAPGIHSTAALDEEFVYFAGYNGILYKFEKETGKMHWTIDLGDAIGASIAIHGDYLYTAIETTSRPVDGYVAKVARKDGAIVWRSPWLGQQAHSTPTIDIARDQIYLGANNKKIFALSEKDGSLIWEQDVGGEVKGTLTLVRDRIVFASWSGKLEARHVQDGRLLWSYDLGLKSQSSATYVPAEDSVVIGGNSGFIHSVDVETGRRNWQVDTGWGHLRASALLVGDDSERKRWNLWMPCSEFTICALRPKDGRILKRIELSSQLTGVPVAFGDSLYLALDEDGGLLRLKPQ